MFRVPFSHIAGVCKRFASDCRGNVATLFALTALPVILVAGLAVDYSRALMEKERVQHALDAAGLAIAREPKNASVADLQKKAQSFFDAGFRAGAIAMAPVVTVARAGKSLRLQVATRFDTSFIKIVGVDSLPIEAASTVRNERQKIEIALVLDNTGSMASQGKMDALKAAVSELITKLKANVIESDDVKLSIVPFNTEVRMATSNVNAAWLRWDVTLENSNLGWTARQPPSRGSWQGCVSDRDQPHDISGGPATDHFRRYVASKCHYAGLTEMAPLTTDLEAIRARAHSMTPTGNTNVTIGLAMGLATLRPDSPLGASASSDANVKKFVILLTDGDNTMNRWTSNSGQIDDRLRQACAATPSDVSVFTIRVIAGNGGLLRQCATKPEMYFDVRDASELSSAFRKILDAIDGIRIVS